MFYGWIVVGAALLILAAGPGGAGYVFGVFFPSLLKEFGWSRAELSAASSLSFVVGGLIGPFVGRWTDRFGVRRMVVVGGLIMGVAFALLSLTQSLPQFYVTYLAFAIGISGSSMIPLNTVVAKWFARRRGLALGMIATGVGLGGLVLIPTSTILIANVGWRQTYQILGVAMLAVVVPLGWFVLRERPQDMGLLPDGDPPQERTTIPGGATTLAHAPAWITPGEVLRRADFWIIALGWAFYGVGLMVVLSQGITYFMDRGLPQATASAILSTVAFMGMVGKVGVGFLADRFSPRLLAVTCLGLQALAFAILLGAQTEIMGYLFAVILGVSMGGLFPLQSVLLVRHFGLAAFASVMGLFGLPNVLFTASSPIIAGWIFDTTRSYAPFWMACIVFDLLAAGLFLLLLRPPQPEKVL